MTRKEAFDCSIEAMINDPTASQWFRDALRTAMLRDPVDAANDAKVLAKVLNEWSEIVHN